MDLEIQNRTRLLPPIQTQIFNPLYWQTDPNPSRNNFSNSVLSDSDQVAVWCLSISNRWNFSMDAPSLSFIFPIYTTLKIKSWNAPVCDDGEKLGIFRWMYVFSPLFIQYTLLWKLIPEIHFFVLVMRSEDWGTRLM